jgi:hypothetical protein
MKRGGQAVSLINRRDLIKGTSSVIAYSSIAGITGIFTGCAGPNIVYSDPDAVEYPLLRGHKVQPLKSGCYIGFMGCWERKPSDWNPLKSIDSHYKLSTYKDNIGHYPAILTRDPIYSFMSLQFPYGFVTGGEDIDFIPLLYYSIKSAIEEHGSLKSLLNSKKFITDTENYAKSIALLQKPMFVCTMMELNLGMWPWGKQPYAAIEVWKLIWNIFEDQGANEYATWVWEVYCKSSEATWVDYPLKYYPGDKYVDWIGLSAFAWEKESWSHKSFSSLVGPTYSAMRMEHPDKPIIQSEFGVYRGSSQTRKGKLVGEDGEHQSEWLISAFETIRSWPGMKAAIYSNQTTFILNIYEDHTLDKRSRAVFREYMNSGYFVGADGIAQSV